MKFYATFFIVFIVLSTHLTAYSQKFADLRYEYSVRIDDYLFTDTDSALHYSQKLLELGLEYNDSLTIGEGYEFMGNCHYYQNDIKGALVLFEKARVIYEAIGDSMYLGLIYVSFGNAYSDLGQFSKCLVYYNKGEKLLQKHSEYPEDLALLYYNMAHVFMDLNDIDNLKKYVSKSKKILLAEEIEYLYPALNNIESDLAIRQKRLDEAEEFALKALKGANAQDDLIQKVFSFQNLAAISSERENVKASIQFQDSAVYFAKLYGDQSITATQKSTLASYHLKNGDLPAADSLALNSFRTVEKLNSLILTKKTALVLARVLEAKGDFKKSLELYKVHTKASDSLQGFELSENILRSENFMSEHRNTLLKAEAKVLKANNAQNRLLISAAIIGLVLCVLIILLLAIILRSRRNMFKALNNKQALIDQKSQELISKNSELERMNNAKDKLFSIITHDLRQPFNQITSLIQILELTPQVDDSLKEVISEIKESTNHTLSAMNNLLVWSKSQFLNVKTHPEKVEIFGIVDGVLTEMAAGINEKRLGVDIDIEENTTLLADRNHIEIILRNLLSNAAKFSPIGGTLKIQAQQSNDFVEIAIIDEGKGMTQEEIERLFDTESHFSTPGTLNEKGSGLGMLIVSEFIKENNGTINVISQKNIGSTFKVMLPAA